MGCYPFSYDPQLSHMIPRNPDGSVNFEDLPKLKVLPKERTLTKYDNGTYDINRYQITLVDYQNLCAEKYKLEIEIAKLREENTELKKPKPPIKQPLPPRNAKLWLVHFLILAVSLGLIIYETFLLYMRAHLER